MKQKLLILSHCYLNTASKVRAEAGSICSERQLHRQLLKEALAADVGLLQLPCPEFRLYGSRRFGHVKDQFMHPSFRESSKEMLRPVILQLQEYAAYPDEYEILGIAGVNGSPSCGVTLTCRGPWVGEVSMQLASPDHPLDKLYMSPERGMFMEVLEQELAAASLEIPLLTAEEALAKILSFSVNA